MSSEVIVQLHHLSKITGFSVKPGLCRRGTRLWFAENGLDYQSFKKNGIRASELLAVGDAFAVAVVEQVTAMERAS